MLSTMMTVGIDYQTEIDAPTRKRKVRPTRPDNHEDADRKETARNGMVAGPGTISAAAQVAEKHPCGRAKIKQKPERHVVQDRFFVGDLGSGSLAVIDALDGAPTGGKNVRNC